MRYASGWNQLHDCVPSATSLDCVPPLHVTVDRPVEPCAPPAASLNKGTLSTGQLRVQSTPNQVGSYKTHCTAPPSLAPPLPCSRIANSGQASDSRQKLLSALDYWGPRRPSSRARAPAPRKHRRLSRGRTWLRCQSSLSGHGEATSWM